VPEPARRGRRGILSGFSLNPGSFEVAVRSGIVTITGQAENRDVASRLLDAIRHVEAVVGVRDRISYPHEEQTGTTRTSASSMFTAKG
jgi:osmotically-inducible protein OsmY